ncbi:MAG: adenylate/guanylate cyclase domain-containing protein [Actinobacteria bacterium]|nr:adenylate/guanylate cyclase domain-containing protein [Actinomycetota bacterium]
MEARLDRPGLARSVFSRVTTMLLVSNWIAASLDFLYLTFVLPPYKSPPNRATHDTHMTFFLLLVFLAVALPIAFMVGNKLMSPAWRWLAEDRAPTEYERRTTLTLPLRTALLVFGVWVAASLVFSVYTYTFRHDLRQGATSGIGVLIGGLITTALNYLLAERLLRPAVAYALQDQPPERTRVGVRPRLMLSWALGSGIPLLGIVMALNGNSTVDRTQLTRAVTLLAVLGLVIGWLVMAVAARSVADPLREVRAGLRRVREGTLDVEVPVDDGGEIGLVQAGFNQMAAGLREREKLRELFGRHVGEEVARQALERSAELGGEQREVSALFVDIMGSTSMAQDRPPAQVVEALNTFFDRVVRVVGDEGGWVNKFEGDGALCVFGAPADQPDHAARALRAARRLRLDLDGLAPTDLDAGIGVSTGIAVAGNVGAAERYEYTVIGDPVNEASRLCDAAKQRPSRVLASGTSVESAGDEASHWAPVGELELRGRRTATRAFEPVPRQGADATALQASSTPSSSTS